MPRRWLLRIEFAGIEHRWSDAAVTAVDDLGVEHRFAGGLPDLRLPSDYDPLRNAPDMRSVSIEIAFPKYDPLHVAIEQGHDFTKATAELSLWTVGDSYDDRVIVLTGSPSEPQHGGTDETVRFTIKAQPWIDNGSTHKPTWVNDEHTTGVSTGIRFQYLSRLAYPLVFGQPGIVNRNPAGLTGFFGFDFVSPAYPFDFEYDSLRDYYFVSKLIICGMPVDASNVRVASTLMGIGEPEDLPVEHTRDFLGNPIAIVDLSHLSMGSLGYAVLPDGSVNPNEGMFRWAIPYEPYNQWFVAWNDGGGITGPNGYIRTAGDLMEWMLIRLQQEVDWPHWSSVKPWFDRYELSGVILEPANVWQFIEDVILSVVPSSATVGPRGIRFVPYRWDAERTLAKAHIRVGPGVTTPDRMTYDRVTDRATAFRLRYNPDMENEFKDELTIVAKAKPDANEITSGAIRRMVPPGSQESVVDTESAWVCRRETAARILRGMADMAQGTRTEVVHVTGDDYDDLEDGDVVEFTNAERSIEGRLCIVHVSHLSPDLRVLHLRLLPEQG